MKTNKETIFIFFVLWMLFGVISLFWGCNTDTEKFRILEKHSNGSPKFIEYPTDSEGVSRFEEFYESGEIRLRFFFKDEVMTKQSTSYFKNGEIRSICHYENGKRQGSYSFFNENGIIDRFLLYENDQLVYTKKFDSAGKEIDEIVSHNLEFYQDTIPFDDPAIRFSVSLPLPDSLMQGRTFYFGYGIKPEYLRDSFTFDPELMLETPISNSEKMEFVVDLQESGNQLFYSYLIDRDNKDLFYPGQIDIQQKDSFWLIIQISEEEAASFND
jgi:hypothetical protein